MTGASAFSGSMLILKMCGALVTISVVTRTV
jgi:hypothetical protein